MANYKGYLQDSNNNNLYIENSYSINEIKTNQTWIDGKPIYKKIIKIQSITFNTSDKVITHNISNLNEVINFRYTMRYPTNGRWYVNWDMIDTKNITIDSSKIYMASVSGGNTIFSPMYILLEYTKTTD